MVVYDGQNLDLSLVEVLLQIDLDARSPIRCPSFSPLRLWELLSDDREELLGPLLYNNRTLSQKLPRDGEVPSSRVDLKTRLDVGDLHLRRLDPNLYTRQRRGDLGERVQTLDNLPASWSYAARLWVSAPIYVYANVGTVLLNYSTYTRVTTGIECGDSFFVRPPRFRVGAARRYPTAHERHHRDLLFVTNNPVVASL